jgi:uncharacterized protein YeaO (DUF488 family)
MDIRTKRIYEEDDKSDGQRVLIDRLWPRGVKKEDAHFDLWQKELAPSSELRKWFGHDPEKWSEFKKRYSKELDSHPEEIADLLKRAKEGRLTLIFAAKDTDHSNAAALKEYLEQHAG